MSNEIIDISSGESLPTNSGLLELYPPEEEQDPGAEKKFIVFLLGEEHLAVETGAVSEVVRELNTTYLPNLPDWLVGIANLRGEIVTVIDLERLLGTKPRSGSLSPKHIVMRVEALDALIAFSVDKLREIVTVSESEIRSGPSTRENPFLIGTIAHKSIALRVLDPHHLLAALKLN